MPAAPSEADNKLRRSPRSFLAENFVRIGGIAVSIAALVSGCAEPKSPTAQAKSETDCPQELNSDGEVVYIGTAVVDNNGKTSHKSCGDIRLLDKFKNCTPGFNHGDEINMWTTFDCPQDGTHYMLKLHCEYPSSDDHCLQAVYNEKVYQKDSSWTASSVK